MFRYFCSLIPPSRQKEQKKFLVKTQAVADKDVLERRKGKAFRIKQLKERKLKELKIHNQVVSSRAGAVGRVQLKEKYAALDLVIKHTSKKHSERIKKLTECQKRREGDQEMLLDVEIKELNLTGDEKSELIHAYKYKLNHQKTIDKRESEHMREIHSTEISFIKTIGDMETRMTDQVSELMVRHIVDKRYTQEATDVTVMALKVVMKVAHNKIKDFERAIVHHINRQRLENDHDVEMYQMFSGHSVKDNKRLASWDSVLKRDVPRHDSCYGQYSKRKIPTFDEEFKPDEFLTDKLNQAEAELETLKVDLATVLAAAQDNMTALEARQAAEFNEVQEKFQMRIIEMEIKQEIDFSMIWKRQQAEISDMVAFQKLELETESLVREAELKALFERNVLSSLLDNVADGVISISPAGKIDRFNQAAENMFEFTKEEVMDKNVKLLMESDLSQNHDTCITIS
jgi:PAS domain-containing protein